MLAWLYLGIKIFNYIGSLSNYKKLTYLIHIVNGFFIMNLHYHSNYAFEVMFVSALIISSEQHNIICWHDIVIREANSVLIVVLNYNCFHPFILFLIVYSLTSGEDLFKCRINPGAVMTYAVNSDIISGGYWHNDNILHTRQCT